jgi:hypothetical protein
MSYVCIAGLYNIKEELRKAKRYFCVLNCYTMLFNCVSYFILVNSVLKLCYFFFPWSFSVQEHSVKFILQAFACFPEGLIHYNLPWCPND